MFDPNNVTAYVRRIGTGFCCTFPNGDFTMLKDGEEEMLPPHILQTVQDKGHYEGEIPSSIYWSHRLVMSDPC